MDPCGVVCHGGGVWTGRLGHMTVRLLSGFRVEADHHNTHTDECWAVAALRLRPLHAEQAPFTS